MTSNTLFYGLLVLVVVLVLRDRVPYIGYLPGDFYIMLGNVHVFIPLTSGLLVALAFSVVRGFLGGR